MQFGQRMTRTTEFPHFVGFADLPLEWGLMGAASIYPKAVPVYSMATYLPPHRYQLQRRSDQVRQSSNLLLLPMD
jgi:hypothetical protein